MTSPCPNRIVTRVKPWLAVLMLGAIAAACGGGVGSSSTPEAVLKVFPLQAGYKSLIAKETSTNYSISGDCTGAITTKSTAPSDANFEGAVALSKTNSVSGMVSGCTIAIIATESINYYDSKYLALGSSSPSRYGKFLTAQPPLPISVKLGDTGLYGTETTYSDSSKTFPVGRTDFSYVIELDGTTTNSAIVNFITNSYNESNQLLATQQERLRIVLDGTLTPVSIDIRTATTGTTHLIFTAN